jgi:hypothetical protein
MINLNKKEEQAWLPVSEQWMQLCLAESFNKRKNLVVPNVSWGFHGEYEKDLVVVYPSGWAVEVEIKISIADLRADQKKRHGHNSQYMKQLYFALPLSIYHGKEEVVNSLLPDKAGLIVVNNTIYSESGHNPYLNKYPTADWRTQFVKPAEFKKGAKKLTDRQIQNLMRLAYLRYWSIENRVYKQKLKIVSEKEGGEE